MKIAIKEAVGFKPGTPTLIHLHTTSFITFKK